MVQVFTSSQGVEKKILMVMSNNTFMSTPVDELIKEFKNKQKNIGHISTDACMDIQTIRFKKFVYNSIKLHGRKYPKFYKPKGFRLTKPGDIIMHRNEIR